MYIFDKAMHLDLLCKVQFEKELVWCEFYFHVIKNIRIFFEDYLYYFILNRKEASQIIVIQKQID